MTQAEGNLKLENKNDVASPLAGVDEGNRASDGDEPPGELRKGGERGKHRLWEAPLVCSDHVLGVLHVTLHFQQS